MTRIRSRKALLAAAISVVAAAGTIAGITATASGAKAASHAAVTAAQATQGWANPVTGYPNTINKLNLDGYVIQTSYPLGLLDAGSTYQQTYTATGVTAKAVAGPYKGFPPVQFNYIAMPVTRDIFLLVWLQPNLGHNTFVFNLKDHEVSVVTWDQAGDPSLGSFKILKRGAHRIP
jgi:hypothetical protein